jgi:methionine-rich copper-binding protein CopC
MKYCLSFLMLSFLTAGTFLFSPNTGFGQAPNLRSAANFTLFTTVGAVGSTGISRVIGNVGTNCGDITGFDPLYNSLHDSDALTAQCSPDVMSAYNQLDSTIATIFPAPVLGNGQVLTPGVYSIPQAASLDLNLSFDAQGNPDAVFIIQIEGAFSTTASSKINLINGALARNIFWKVEGAVSMATGTYMRGNIIANNGAISMGAGDTLEGRALSTTGAVSIYGSVAYAPGIVLAVTLIDFKAIQDNYAIELLWKSSNEFSLEGYELQRSADGRNFYNIGTVPATNTPLIRTYKWLDNAPLDAVSFYRLKMIDIDHVFKYSAIAKISMNAGKGISVYPNPVTGHVVMLQMNNQLKGDHIINLYNSNGKKVMSGKTIYDEKNTVRCVALDKNLATGVYYLEVIDPERNKQILNILIN